MSSANSGTQNERAFQREDGRFSWVWFLDLRHLAGHSSGRAEIKLESSLVSFICFHI